MWDSYPASFMNWGKIYFTGEKGRGREGEGEGDTLVRQNEDQIFKLVLFTGFHSRPPWVEHPASSMCRYRRFAIQFPRPFEFVPPQRREGRRGGVAPTGSQRRVGAWGERKSTVYVGVGERERAEGGREATDERKTRETRPTRLRSNS